MQGSPFRMNTMWRYVVATAIALAVVSLVLVGLLTWSIPWTAQSFEASKWSTVTGWMQAVVGGAIALAGAIATIRLAILGLQSVEQGNRREELEDGRLLLTEALGPFLRFAVALGRAIDRAQVCDRWLLLTFDEERRALLADPSLSLHVTHRAIEKWRVFSSHDVYGLSDSARELQNRLRDIRTCLTEMASSPAAVALWNQLTLDRRFVLRDVQLLEGATVTKSFAQGLQLPSLISLWAEAEERHERSAKEAVEILIERWIERVRLHKKNGQSEVEPLLLVGDLLVWRRVMVNLGAALLVDSIQMVPRARETTAFLEDQLGLRAERDLPPSLKRLVEGSEPARLLPPWVVESVRRVVADMTLITEDY